MSQSDTALRHIDSRARCFARDDPERETTPHQATEMVAKERITVFLAGL